MPHAILHPLADLPEAQPVASSAWLRAKTHEHHIDAKLTVAIDSVNSREALAGFLLGWQEVWTEARTAALSEDASPIARAELVVPSATVVSSLGIDLASIDRPVLGLATVRAPRAELTDLLSRPGGAWGVAYVLLGSRLGNVAIAPRLRAELNLPGACCPAFLAPRVAHLGRDWNAFRSRLDATPLDHSDLDDAVAAARWTFRWVGAVLAGRIAPVTERAAA